MKFVYLNVCGLDGFSYNKCYINMDKVYRILKLPKCTALFYCVDNDENPIYVTESPEEIIEKIKEAK